MNKIVKEKTEKKECISLETMIVQVFFNFGKVMVEYFPKGQQPSYPIIEENKGI